MTSLAVASSVNRVFEANISKKAFEIFASKEPFARRRRRRAKRKTIFYPTCKFK